MKFRLSVLLTTLVVTFAACSPGLNVRMLPPEVPEPKTENLTAITGSPLRVSIGPVTDARPSPALAKVPERQVLPDGEVTAAVRDALMRYYQKAGAEVVTLNAPKLNATIDEWVVNVTPKFPASEINANAKIHIEIRNETDMLLYRGQYEGESTLQHPYASEGKIREVLGEAMGAAITEAVNDQGLLGKLSGQSLR